MNVVINPRLVRGLDYYTKTVFEIKCDVLGAQSSVCGGGRYDNLVQEFEGDATPAVGVAFGLERVMMLLDKLNLFSAETSDRKISVYVAALSGSAKPLAVKLVNDLRQRSIVCTMDYLSRSAKAQFKSAAKLNAAFVAVIGEQEVIDQVIAVKNMSDGVQTVMSYAEAVKYMEE